MALTNFAALTENEKIVWARDVWKNARNMSFMSQFMGKGPNSIIHRVTELTKTEKGAKAILTLVPDLVGDGVAGDDTLEGQEEALSQSDIELNIDQLRHANRHKGRMAEQKSVVNFREQSRDALSYWLADRMDQLAFLTLAGVAYTKDTDGGTRAGSAFANLSYAADVTAPSTNRHFQWDQGTLSLVAPDTPNIVADDKPSYAMLVNMRAKARDLYIRGVRGEGNNEMYHVFMTPQGMARLKLDADFINNVRYAAPRSNTNPLFKGASSYLVDGMWVHDFRYVPNNTGTTLWGSGNTVKGQYCLLCGAQALGFADLGAPEWEEKTFDFGNQQAISVGKIMGFRKPKFTPVGGGAAEDFGVMVVNTAI